VEVATEFRKPRTLVDEVAAHLRERIVNGRLSPGERLNELRLMHEFVLSRSPIREALRVLAAEGLVVIEPRRGTVVRPVSTDDLRDLFEVRALFETFALGQAIGHRYQHRTGLQALLDEARRLLGRRDVAGWYESSQRFHDAIVGAGGNAHLKTLYDAVKGAMRRYQLLVIGLPQHPARSQAEHEAIFAAFDRGDATRATALLRAHIQRVAETLGAALSGRPAAVASHRRRSRDGSPG
jgi:DNA-binding GntR family transcriptional regulator